MIDNKKLTGRYYFQKTLLGMVLMVEERVKRIGDPPFVHFRKAKPEDVLNPKLEFIKYD